MAAEKAADAKNEASSKTVKKTKGKKRRRVSKHIIVNKAKSAAGPTNDQDHGDSSSPSSSKSKSKKVKDPQEAIAYLEQWKKSRGNWKFNKNTQSWLIRHMYDASLISKHDFEVLLEYLQDSHADVKRRLCQDATQRAVRYQRHVEAKPNTTDKNDEAYQKMNEHEKRKEYKRARKLLDALPVSSNKSA